MASYLLFGENISFSDAAERFYNMYYRTVLASADAEAEFLEWYKKQGNISAVLSGYREQAADLVLKYAVVPLYDELVDLGIYDVTKIGYAEECLVAEEFTEAFETVADKYNEIVTEQEEKINYRAERKAGRARVVGGGFGVSGAVKGMATAGVMNAASGLGHSLVNAIGNAASSMAASSAKKALYQNQNTAKCLATAIKEDVISSYSAHVDLVNRKKGNYYHNAFDVEKSVALFESATKVKEKRQALLREAFVLCPWYSELIVYIFIHYPEEAENVWKIGKRFHVDLREPLETLFGLLYSNLEDKSPQGTRRLRHDIRAIMEKLDVSSSSTLDQIERDGISEILRKYEKADEGQRKEMFTRLGEFDASQQNKAAVVHEKLVWELAQEYGIEFSESEVEKILQRFYTDEAKKDEAEAQKAKEKMKAAMTALKVEKSNVYDCLEHDSLARLCRGYNSADKESCDRMIEKIKAYPGEERNKNIFIKKIRDRIKEIRDKNEDDSLHQLFQNTNIRDPKDVEKTLALIGKTGSACASKYVRILKACNRSNIRKSRLCYSGWGKFCKVLGISLVALGGAMLFVKVDNLIRIGTFAMGGFFGYTYYRYHKAWEDLTNCGEIFHRMLFK